MAFVLRSVMARSALRPNSALSLARSDHGEWKVGAVSSLSLSFQASPRLHGRVHDMHGDAFFVRVLTFFFFFFLKTLPIPVLNKRKVSAVVWGAIGTMSLICFGAIKFQLAKA